MVRVAKAFVVVLSLACVSFGQQRVQFDYTFERGLNLRDRPERVPVGYACGNSYNFDFYQDGTARSRGGRVVDYAAAGSDTSVNLMGSLLASTTYYPRARGLVLAGNRAFIRNNATGAYTSTSIPSGLVTGGADMLQSIEFDGNLIVGGDISALGIFDGESFSRLAVATFEEGASGVARLATGGRLASGETYTYAWTFVTKHGYETYRGGKITAPPTTTTSKVVNITGFPRFPVDFTGTPDTATVVARRWYRSDDGGVTGGFLTSQPLSETSLSDSGQFDVDETVNFPMYQSVEPTGYCPVVTASQLWFLARNEEHSSPYVLAAPLAADGTTISVTPGAVENSETGIGKVAFGGGFYKGTLSDGRRVLEFVTDPNGVNTWKYRTVSGEEGVVLVGDANQDGAVSYADTLLIRDHIDGAVSLTGDSLLAADVDDSESITADDNTTLDEWLVSSGRYLLSRGVVPGDYVTWVKAEAGEYMTEVVGVPDDRTLIVEDDVPISVSGSTVTKLVGRNIVRIDDEYIAIGGLSDDDDGSGALLVAKSTTQTGRGLFGSTPAVHGTGSRVTFIASPQGPSHYVIRSATYNPLRHQTGFPIEIPASEVTGMFSGSGYVGVCSKSAVYQIVGTDIPAVYTLAEGVGNVSFSSVVPQAGGAFMLDDMGVHYVGTDGSMYLSEVLGDAIRDSAYSSYLQKATAHYYLGKLYVGVVSDSDLGSDVWVGTIASSSGPVWTRYTGWSVKEMQMWEDGSGNRDLFFGGWDEGAVYQYNEARSYDETSAGASQAITAQVVTPAYSAQGSFTTWDYAILNIDTRDSVRVDAIISTKVGAGGGVSDKYETNILVLSPSAGDTTEAGVMMSHRINIGASGFTCQLRIWKSGTGGTVVFPGAIYGSLQEM